MKIHSETYHETKLRPLVQIIANMVAAHPELAREPERLMASLAREIPGFADQTKCVNCGASMAEYTQTLDINDALLLINMAKIVRNNRKDGRKFTDANKVRVSSAQIHHTQKCRTTKCSKLGLIAQAGNSEWSITTRGWAALRGERVPSVRVTYRGEILERPENTVTFAEIFMKHQNKMRDRERRKLSLKNDKRITFSDYEPSEWYTINDYQQGKLI